MAGDSDVKTSVTASSSRTMEINVKFDVEMFDGTNKVHRIRKSRITSKEKCLSSTIIKKN